VLYHVSDDVHSRPLFDLNFRLFPSRTASGVPRFLETAKLPVHLRAELGLSTFTFSFITFHLVFTGGCLRSFFCLFASLYLLRGIENLIRCYIMLTKDSSIVPSRMGKTKSQVAVTRSSNHVEPSDPSIFAAIQDPDERELAQMGYKQVRGYGFVQVQSDNRPGRSSAVNSLNGPPCPMPSLFWASWARSLPLLAYPSRQAVQQLRYGHGSSAQSWQNASPFQVRSPSFLLDPNGDR
jgi:hypothetical protein